jgi:mRNA interferase RelE/StbE
VTAAYELATSPPARRALAEKLPHDVAVAALELITGPLLESPRRLGRPLGKKLTGVYSARLARDWRVLYRVDEDKHVVFVLDVRHRSAAYRP